MISLFSGRSQRNLLNRPQPSSVCVFWGSRRAVSERKTPAWSARGRGRSGWMTIWPKSGARNDIQITANRKQTTQTQVWWPMGTIATRTRLQNNCRVQKNWEDWWKQNTAGVCSPAWTFSTILTSTVSLDAFYSQTQTATALFSFSTFFYHSTQKYSHFKLGSSHRVRWEGVVIGDIYFLFE